MNFNKNVTTGHLITKSRIVYNPFFDIIEWCVSAYPRVNGSLGYEHL